jgi:trehalose 6-phosphate synthase/phosphatase
MQELSPTKEHRLARKINLLAPETVDRIVAGYKRAKNRLMLLDYDGVLTELIRDIRPDASKPTKELLATLRKLSDTPGNEVMVISGRPKDALEGWLGGMPMALGAEHGAWTKDNGNWTRQYDIPSDWKKPYLSILEAITRLTPESHIEIKQFSLVWHFRNVEPELAFTREIALKQALDKLAVGSEIGIFEGHKIIEIKPRLITKGATAKQKLTEQDYDFILCIGDDYTDEEMFAALPNNAVTIKVGLASTCAKYHIKSVAHVKSLLAKLAAAFS